MVSVSSDLVSSSNGFYTQKGSLGFGPKWIQEGDLVCLIQHCRVPLLLQKVDNHYEFIITSFVLVIISSEVAEMVNTGNLPCCSLRFVDYSCWAGVL